MASRTLYAAPGPRKTAESWRGCTGS